MKRLCFVALLSVASAANTSELKVSEPSAECRQTLHLSSFYKQCVDANGFAIVASEKPAPAALLEAAWIVNHMLDGREDIRQAIIKSKTRLAVMAYNEFTTDIPEHSDLKPAEHWNKRARGLGATKARPAVSCAEENVLCLKGDPYKGENILVHEFAHVIHEIGMETLDKTFDSRLQDVFKQALADGLWKGTYAASNHHEYWAEAVQSWFDTNRVNDFQHNNIDTREKLKNYDPRVAALLEEVFKNNEWRYSTPDKRANLEHLAGFDVSKAPAFSWPESLLKKKENKEKAPASAAPKSSENATK
jgi:hypothetical protein